MFLALLIVGMLVYLISLSESCGWEKFSSRGLRWILAACMASLLVQLFLGTQVRESLDVIASGLPNRNQWIDALGIRFLVHRSFSIVVLLLNAVLALKFGKTLAPKALPVALIILILGNVLTGVGMAYWAVPDALQPVHLVLATGAFGVQLLLLFRLKPGIRQVLTN
jgi:heme a synthase